jgi:hypothetical protein
MVVPQSNVLNGALDERQICRACYALLVITAMELPWNGIRGFAA